MSKTKKILLWIFSLIFVLSSMLSLTLVLAKYVTEKGGFGSVGDDEGHDLPYEIASPVVVNTQEELFEALQYGYPYVKLGEQLKNPFIVTEDVTTMSRSLILDLNGKEIQRNSREPMLVVPENISLTIIDSSIQKKGGLYNPVGSVLSVRGGSLTAAAGKYESGPRPSEYYSQPDGSVQNKIGASQAFDVAYKTGVLTQQMPVFNPIITKDAGGLVRYVDGNVYFDVAHENIPADTYCYYVSSDGFSAGDTVAFDKTAADFSYSYYVEPSASANAYQFKSLTQPAGTVNVDYVKVTIYGYHDDIAYASRPVTDPAYPDVTLDAAYYAAIRMRGGTFTVNIDNADPDVGSFWSYFGVPKTACIYMSGGTMSINTTGTISNVDPSVIREINPNGLANEGRGNCIFTSETNTGTLNIAKGNFYSYTGDTVRMFGGSIHITGGTFQKDASLLSTESTFHTENGAILDAYGGNITVSGESWNHKIPFTLKGSGNSAIMATKTKAHTPEVSVANASFTSLQERAISFRNNVGIYNRAGKVRVDNCDFTMNGYNALGIVSVDSPERDVSPDEKGSVEADDVLFMLGGDKARGVYQKDGSTIVRTGVFSMTGTNATGIVASSGSVTIGDAPTTVSFTHKSESDSAPTVQYGDVNVPQGSVFFYIDRCVNCYGVKAGKNDAIGGDDVGTISDESVVNINLNSVQVLLGQGRDTDGRFYYEKTIETIRNDPSIHNPELGEVLCAGIFSNLKNATVNAKRALFVVAGAYSAAIHANKGTVIQQSNRANDKVYGKLCTVVGSYYTTYQNGGTTNGNIDNPAWLVSQVTDAYLTQDKFETFPKQNGFTSAPNTESSFGIASLGGNIDCENLFVRLKGAYSAGIYVTHGMVEVVDLQQIIHDETDLSKGEAEGTQVFGTAAVAVTVDSSGSKAMTSGVVVHDGDIWTNGIGLVVSSTEAVVSRTDYLLVITGKLEIQSPATTAILVAGGNVNLTDTADVTITSAIKHAQGDELTPLPWDFRYVTSDMFESGTYALLPQYKYNYAGIKITGGTLTSKGNLFITHTGLANEDKQDGQVCTDFAVKSFALNIDAPAEDQIQIDKIQIDCKVGGGIGVNGGNLTLGTATDMSYTDPTGNAVAVYTEGDATYGVTYKDSGANFTNNNNWAYQWNKTGGFALSVKGGDVTVNSGYFHSNGSSAAVVKDGNATINGGWFFAQKSKLTEAGPAANYALAVLGGNLTVNGGLFGGKEGSIAAGVGIMLRGSHGVNPDGSTSSASNNADFNFYGGTVNAGKNAAAICVFEHVNATFGVEGGDNSKVVVRGSSSTYTVEESGYCSEGGASTVKIVINGGTYTNYRDDQNNQWINIIYNDVKGIDFLINGGTFISESADTGIFFRQYSENFKIAGGTFTIAGNSYKALFEGINDRLVKNLLADGKQFYVYDQDGNEKLLDVDNSNATAWWFNQNAGTQFTVK